MKQPASQTTTSISDKTGDQSQPAAQPVRQLRVAQALFETTWRILVPVVIMAGAGIFADISLRTKPFLTLLGTIIGFVFAGLLVARLLKESENEN